MSIKGYYSILFDGQRHVLRGDVLLMIMLGTTVCALWHPFAPGIGTKNGERRRQQASSRQTFLCVLSVSF